MPELSTLLRQRLRAAEDPASRHPDADVLSAYVEELLLAPEHDQVLKHLSLCSQCREVVALTMPETVAEPEPQAEAAAAAVVSAQRRRWFRSPAFGLAGSIAAMVLGVALILRLPPTARQPEMQQLQEAKAPPISAPGATNGLVSQNGEPATSPAVKQQPAPPAATALQGRAESNARTAGLRDTAPMWRATATREKKEAAPAPVFAAELRKQDYVNKAFLANSYDNQAAAPVFRELPQAPVPAQSNLSFAPPSVMAPNSFQTSAGFEVSSTIAGKNQGVVSFYSIESQRGRETTLMGRIVDFGKRPLIRRMGAPIPSGSVGASAMFKPGVAASEPGDAMAATTPEREEAGVLAQSHAFSSNALAALPRRQMLGAPQYQWKVVQGKLLRSSDQSHWTEENPAGEDVQFSVVHANGPEIWAGGSQAALVHSRDGGTTWVRIMLGAAAVGNINSIEVAGQTVHVKSSSGQSWTSQDGGKSWMLLE